MLQPEQNAIIRRTFDQLEPIASLAAALFYSRLFELAPQTETLFRYPLGTQGMVRQGSKLIETLKVAVEYLDCVEQRSSMLEALARRHVAYGVEPAHYELVGEALLWTIQQVLGNSFTPEVEAAWSALYDDIATTMKRAAYGAQGTVGARQALTQARGGHCEW